MNQENPQSGDLGNPTNASPSDSVTEEFTTLQADSVSVLTGELEESNRERAQYKNLLQRVQADFANYKRRTEEERLDLVKQANANLILQMLLVLDDFERALGHTPVDGPDDQWLEGVSIIERKLRSVLQLAGVSKIQAEGQLFDPREHEALLYEETQDTSDGNVLRVIREGYKLHDRVLRPAQVAIAKAKHPSEEGPQKHDPSSTTKEA